MWLQGIVMIDCNQLICWHKGFDSNVGFITQGFSSERLLANPLGFGVTAGAG